MPVTEVGKKLVLQLQKYFTYIAVNNYIIRNEMVNSVSIIESLEKKPADCHEYTQTAKTYLNTRKVYEGMGMNDMVMFDNLVLDAANAIHGGATSTHSSECIFNNPQ